MYWARSTAIVPDAVDLLEHRTELGVEDALRQRRHAVLELRLAVEVPEELRVRQARAQHALVAGDDGGTAVVGQHVGDDDEARCQRARLGQHREIFLVRAHRGGQHLGRQVHEGGIDRAHQHDRPFDQAGDLVEQALVRFDLELVEAGDLLGVAQDHRAPLRRVEHDVGAAQLRPVVLEVRGLERRRRRGSDGRASCRRTRTLPAPRSMPPPTARPLNRQTMLCNGRTQAKRLAPQRIDFGQPSACTACGIRSTAPSLSAGPVCARRRTRTPPCRPRASAPGRGSSGRRP